MDAVRIQIIRGCDAQGQGGTVVDDAAAILPDLPNGTPVLDALAAAFGEAYGLTYPNPFYDPAQPESEANPVSFPVTPFRNISLRWRLLAMEQLAAYNRRVATAAAVEAADGQYAETLAQVTILENVTG